MNLKMYHDYFMHQAIAHPLLSHTDQNRVFEMIGIDEDYGDLRSKVKEKDYVVRLLEYSYQVSDFSGAFLRKSIRGAFMIAKFYSPRNDSAADYLTALGSAEGIVDNFIEKMIADSKAGHPLFGYSLDRVQDFQIAPTIRPGDGAYAGWECIFTIRPAFDLACDSVGWTDGGITSHM